MSFEVILHQNFTSICKRSFTFFNMRDATTLEQNDPSSLWVGYWAKSLLFCTWLHTLFFFTASVIVAATTVDAIFEPFVDIFDVPLS